jgi:hypothetical protein
MQDILPNQGLYSRTRDYMPLTRSIMYLCDTVLEFDRLPQVDFRKKMAGQYREALNPR